MRWGLASATVVLVILLVWVSGCATTNLGSAQVADFGTTKDAQQAQDWFIEKYGNPATYPGPPRFLEPMVSDGIFNNTPTDKVSKVSQETPSIYFWAFYEGFKPKDQVTAVWTYKDKQYAQLSKPVTGNYGIVYAQFDKPMSGWALGTHTITISGNGAQNSTTFEIINGPTVTAPLPYGGGSTAGSPGMDVKKLGSENPSLAKAGAAQGNDTLVHGRVADEAAGTGSQSMDIKKIRPTNRSSAIAGAGEPTGLEGILERHNFYRDQVGVHHLVWSSELATIAQQWADNKVFGHNPNRGATGENIASVGPLTSAAQVVDMWAIDEKACYNYTTNNCNSPCSMCYHYLQIISGQTTEIGCGKADTGGQMLWVCNYRPIGIIGGQPY